MLRLSTLAGSLLGALLFLGAGGSARAVTCTMSPAMSGEARAALAAAAQTFGTEVLAGNVAALKTGSTPQLATGFGDVAETVAAIAPAVKSATLTLDDLYGLDATDLKTTGQDVQFFCSVPGSQLLVTVTLGELPPGQYALAVLHATGVTAPEQFALVLQAAASQNGASSGSSAAASPAALPLSPSPRWELGGFFARPLTLAGHSAGWFWTQARALQSKNDRLSAFLYYQEASFLARPADLYTSNNFQKLNRETAAAEPPGLPGNTPMQVVAGDETFPVTALRCDATLGPLDLRIDTRYPNTADPVAARKAAVSLMSAMLAQYPPLRQAFHGFWVYETGTNGGSFAVEQPMSALP